MLRRNLSRPARSPQAGAEDAKHALVVGGRTVKRFVPFSEGVRDCVGQNLARLNLTTTLAQLFGSFSFRLAEEVEAPCSLVRPWPPIRMVQSS